MVARLPEQWTLLRENPSTESDPLTGNPIPVAPTEIKWTGLLQQRFIETKQDEIGRSVVVSELVLLLTPGLPGGVNRRDILRFDGPAKVADIVPVKGKVTVHGTPRVRRPARGSRRPAYIAAIVTHTSDME